MVDTETIETKIVDEKEKVEDKTAEAKEKIKAKAEEKKEEIKAKKVETEERINETKERGRTIRDNVSKDINEGYESVRGNVKNIQKIIDEKINEYKTATVQSLATEVLEGDDAYYVRVAVPGAEKDTIEVNAGDNEISIEATFVPLSETMEDVDVILNELKIGRCAKTIKFSSAIQMDAVKAKFGLGIVDITVPKVPKPSTKVDIE